MLNDFLSIIDRLIALKEYRNKRLQSVYQNLLEPIFNDLLLVHRDYIQMFEKVHEMIVGGWKNEAEEISVDEFIERIRKAAEYLKARRLEFESVRVKLMTTIGELHGISPNTEKRKPKLGSEADSFVDAVFFYFRSPYLDHDFGRESTAGTLMLELLVDLGSQLPERITEEGFIDRAIEQAASPRYGVINQEAYSPRRALYEFEFSLERKMRQLRINWSLVCEAYAQLKVSVVMEV
jgi:hypothetical protein